MGTNFPGFFNSMDFAAFFYAMENCWGNACVSHLMKYTIGWRSNRKKAIILWEKYKYQFSRLLSYDGFCCTFLCYGKLMTKHMHFPYDEVYHRMRI